MKQSTIAAVSSFTIILSLLSGSAAQSKTTSRMVRFTPPHSGEMKVMTFNIRVDTMLDGWHRWKQRKPLVIDTITDNSADIFGLQEAKNKQLQDIRRAMPQYGTYAVGRNNGASKGESCPIFYRKDRFRLNDSGTFWFSNTPSKPGSKDWGNLWPRICSWVHLTDKTAGTGFYVYNVHLDNLSQHSRELSVRMLAGRIAARKTRDPFLVMGDFNMEMDNPAMRYLEKIGYSTPYPRMSDAWSLVNVQNSDIGTRHGFSGRISGPKIDHIPLCENAIPLSVKIDRRSYNGHYPSDHFPVIATIFFKEPTQVTYKAPMTPAITEPSIPGV